MKVVNVSASIRYSKPVGDGSFKTIEIAAEGTLTPNENWQDAQSDLYDQLAGQLRQIWTKKGQKTTSKHATSTLGIGTGEKSLSNPETPETSKKITHSCAEHGVAFRRYEKNGHEWYSHKVDDGTWCREKS
ncbi:MAG: hypothetical protein QF898_05260 [SAR202 cluster bacterium]|jgi:hypothetical protein|nr:hypothetical protein [SAR202 cluster bacterium]